MPLIQPKRVEIKEVEIANELKKNHSKGAEMKFERLSIRPHRDQSQLLNDKKMEKIVSQAKRDKVRVSELRKSSWGCEQDYVRDIKMIEQSQLIVDKYLKQHNVNDDMKIEESKQRIFSGRGSTLSIQ